MSKQTPKTDDKAPDKAEDPKAAPVPGAPPSAAPKPSDGDARPAGQAGGGSSPPAGLPEDVRKALAQVLAAHDALVDRVAQLETLVDLLLPAALDTAVIAAAVPRGYLAGNVDDQRVALEVAIPALSRVIGDNPETPDEDTDEDAA